MKVAVPEWEGRVSPVFDTARHILCFEVGGDAIHAAGEAEALSDQPLGAIPTLQGLGVNVLLCGAISRPLAAMIAAAGIRVLPFLAGDVQEIVNAFAEGRLDGADFQMPGYCGQARRHRAGHCGRRWKGNT